MGRISSAAAVHAPGLQGAINDVWAYNLDVECERLLVAAERCHYVAVDFEFPGVVLPSGRRRPETAEERYDSLRDSVDSTRPIQLGLALTDKAGSPIGCWQFNLQFDDRIDRADRNALRFLTDAGLDLRRHASIGVETNLLGEKLMSSGLVLTDDIRWLAFHGMYDFAYLLKMISGTSMPYMLSEFDRTLDDYFPKRLDIKQYLPRGSLSRLGQEHGLRRCGREHQGGSDALMTAELFFRSVARTSGDIEMSFDGRLYGLHSVLPGAAAAAKEVTAEKLKRIRKAQVDAIQQRYKSDVVDHTSRLDAEVLGHEDVGLWEPGCAESFPAACLAEEWGAGDAGQKALHYADRSEIGYLDQMMMGGCYEEANFDELADYWGTTTSANWDTCWDFGHPYAPSMRSMWNVQAPTFQPYY